LAEFLGLPYSSSMDDLLDAFIATATSLVIAHTNHELLARDWYYKVKLEDALPGGVSPIYIRDPGVILLPTFPVNSVDEVIEDDESITVDADLDMIPAQVIAVGQTVEITYNAGYALASDIPSGLLTAVKMLAGFMYENRGCSAVDALNQSGAYNMLAQYKLMVTL
jgi:hypothetical protein